ELGGSDDCAQHVYSRTKNNGSGEFRGPGLQILRAALAAGCSDGLVREHHERAWPASSDQLLQLHDELPVHRYRELDEGPAFSPVWRRYRQNEAQRLRVLPKRPAMELHRHANRQLRLWVCGLFPG